jgi:hypothetical protein
LIEQVLFDEVDTIDNVRDPGQTIQRPGPGRASDAVASFEQQLSEIGAILPSHTRDQCNPGGSAVTH